MKSNLATIALTIMLMAAWGIECHAGAWTARKYSFYNKLAFNYYFSDQTFDSSRDRVDTASNGEFDDFNISNYFEFGLTDDLTVINSFAYKWLENDTDQVTSKAHGIGDIDLGARYKLLDNAAGIVSAQYLMKIPGGYSKNDPLPLGNAQYDHEFRLLYGRSLYPFIPGYGNVELGYRWRTGDPSDEYRYLIEFGMDFTERFYGRAKLDGILSRKNGRDIDRSGNPTATNNYDLGKLDLALGYKVRPSWGVEASYVPELYGKNTSAGATYSLAVYFKTP